VSRRKIVHGLHVGASAVANWPAVPSRRNAVEPAGQERGKREEKLADTARVRGAEFADTALARGSYLPTRQSRAASHLADVARQRVGEGITTPGKGKWKR